MSVCISFTYLGAKWVCRARAGVVLAGTTCATGGQMLSADRGVEKMALMSHKISKFQLNSIVKNLICAATRIG